MICGETYRIFSGDPYATCSKQVDEYGLHKGEHQGFVMSPAVEPKPDGASWERDGRPAGVQVMTWDRGGGMARNIVSSVNCLRCKDGDHDLQAHAPRFCAECGNLYDPTGHIREYMMEDPRYDHCFSCALWLDRADHFGVQQANGNRSLREHPSEAQMDPNRLYTWCPGGHGAFGGRKFAVAWSDGTTVGPDDVLWDGGEIPWWLRSRFSPNAVIRSIR